MHSLLLAKGTRHMGNLVSRIGEVKPNVAERACGGWLALSPAWARFSIGVTAPTEKEAIEKFHQTYARWVSIMDDTLQKST
jgi:hypothetical protein